MPCAESGTDRDVFPVLRFVHHKHEGIFHPGAKSEGNPALRRRSRYVEEEVIERVWRRDIERDREVGIGYALLHEG